MDGGVYGGGDVGAKRTGEKLLGEVERGGLSEVYLLSFEYRNTFSFK